MTTTLAGEPHGTATLPEIKQKLLGEGGLAGTSPRPYETSPCLGEVSG